MIYDDRPLAQEGVKTSKLSGKWDPQSLSSNGTGVLMEGVFHKMVKHTIQDSTGTKVSETPEKDDTVDHPEVFLLRD
jgi:hypothetical protein